MVGKNLTIKTKRKNNNKNEDDLPLNFDEDDLELNIDEDDLELDINNINNITKYYDEDENLENNEHIIVVI